MLKYVGPNMFTTTVLLVSHDKSLRDAVSQVGHRIKNCEIETCDCVAEVMSVYSQKDVSLALLHVAKPNDETIVPEFLWEAALAHQSPSVLVLSDLYCPDVALEYFRMGVLDYLNRPLDLGRLARWMDELTIQARCIGSDKQPRQLLSGESDLMRQVQAAAQSGSTILIGGETGSGKTRLARLLHEMSPRHGRPFLTVNCGSLSPTLMESEMFGHAKGAFTGADRPHSGKFSDVADGTLFLDEIDTLDPVMQAKLLRVIENREFEPVGSNKTLAVRARLIVASNRDLEVEVAERRFRQDLLFRIKVIDFTMPPLRERIGDVPMLALAFLHEFVSRDQSASEKPRPDPKLTSEVIKAFEAYDWPGNIRELRNVIERLVLLCPGAVIQLQDLPSQFQQGRTVARFDMTTNGKPVDFVQTARLTDEATRVMEAMEATGNNCTKAAQSLGISRAAFYKKLHKFGLLPQALRGRGDNQLQHDNPTTEYLPPLSGGASAPPVLGRQPAWCRVMNTRTDAQNKEPGG